jgi:hypothetical protein
MNLRTTFEIEPSGKLIDYATPVLFLGSCFSSEIGKKMADGKMDVLINPSGTLYNPFSVQSFLDDIMTKRVFSEEDLYHYHDEFLSFSHYAGFTSDKAGSLLEKINTLTGEAHNFLRRARFIFITFGTARVYRLKESGKIVANCHKLPSSYFSRELLSVTEIYDKWTYLIDRIRLFNNNLNIIFTISPVRHWKDGAHGNQVSKSILFLAVEKLLEHPAVYGYFPAYEIIMDDLRDYRYYADDMLHPSQVAIDYIWKAFTDCYFDPQAFSLWNEVYGITKAMSHRFLSDSIPARNIFAANILRRIRSIRSRNNDIDLSSEIKYFESISSGES